MGLCIEVFLLYSLYILFYSVFNSSEERVLVGREPLGPLESAEAFIVRRFGCIIPYSLVSFQVLEKCSAQSLFGVILEIVVYTIIKDSVIIYIKGLKVFSGASVRLPVNPSGHTFMFLNGIYVLCPVVYNDLRSKKRVRGCISAAVVYEYNRLLISTITHYHTFTDVALGAISFLVFRALVRPVRGLYGESTYEKEWGVQECFFLCIGIAILIGVSPA